MATVQIFKVGLSIHDKDETALLSFMYVSPQVR